MSIFYNSSTHLYQYILQEDLQEIDIYFIRYGLMLRIRVLLIYLKHIQNTAKGYLQMMLPQASR